MRKASAMRNHIEKIRLGLDSRIVMRKFWKDLGDGLLPV